MKTTRNTRRILSLILALVMVFTLASVAFAAEETGTITIENGITGKTYTIYRIFDLESHDETGGNFAYKLSTKWISFEADDYFRVNDNGYVEWTADKEDTTAAAFAKAALAYAEKNNIANDGENVCYVGTPVKFENKLLGYYLLDSSVGALCSLTTAKPDATVKEKNEVPELKKEVKEGDDWGDENDAKIGDTVYFQATITVKAGAQDYFFFDTMSEGLTFDKESLKVTLDGEDVVNQLEGGIINWSYYDSDEPLEDDEGNEINSGYTFCIELTTYFLSENINKDVVITYSAVLNEKAVANKKPETNNAKLWYGDDNHLEGVTNTNTWKFDVFKYTDGEVTDGVAAKNPLAGATFTLSTNEDGTNPINLINLKDENDNVTTYYRVAKNDETGSVTEITTDSTGKFTIKGLDSGTYYLTETAAPAGYNKLANPVKVTIDTEGNVTVGDATDATEEVQVKNSTGTELPSTGGMGTTIFYVVGAILVLGTAVLLITKKRMSADA